MRAEAPTGRAVDRCAVNVVASAKWLGHHDVAGPLRTTDERQRKMSTRLKTAAGRSCCRAA
ncbi:hypothetical protein CP967_29530 [Streptomyces nitrosporeus]|uniref:Uncharacterized protein n=1 Tax=Streptomyces nitrosporeus TaxID=28894 RepID=A0A5J6FJT0_9ACTN|nr:hypothetical protein CP967_29530 [Streptomyces nitrosporeus]